MFHATKYEKREAKTKKKERIKVLKKRGIHKRFETYPEQRVFVPKGKKR